MDDPEKNANREEINLCKSVYTIVKVKKYCGDLIKPWDVMEII